MGNIKEVYAQAATQLVNIEEDTVVATVKLSNRALSLIETTTVARPKDIKVSLFILGEKGAVEIGGFAVNEVKESIETGLPVRI